MKVIRQHLVEINQNLEVWKRKRLLRALYGEFYQRITALVREDLPGCVVEIGSGIGNLQSVLPGAIRTDLFPNPWLDLVCDGYELPFRDGTISNLVLFDVFHHLECPMAFLREARRALALEGRLIIFEPFISLTSYIAYGLFHHEPLGMGCKINPSSAPPQPRHYYAAQGNATRLFFRAEPGDLLTGWHCFHREAFSAFSYLLSGGYSKPALYPESCLGCLRGLDRFLSQWPRAFGARCLVGLQNLPRER